MKIEKDPRSLFAVFSTMAMLVLVPEFSAARVFDFSQEYLSTYIRGTGGLSNLNKDAYGAASGATTTFEDKVEFNFSGEVGVALSVSQVTLRLGVEGLVPKELDGIEGKDGSGVNLLTLRSETLGIVPTVSVEIAVYQDASARFLVGIGIGKASVTVTNTYTLTAAGTAALGGVTDYTEVAKGSAIGGNAFAGIESLFTDNVTFTAEVGYRYYQLNELKHDQSAATIVGNVVAGDRAVNSDGSDRTLNLKGLYAGIGLRFYIGL